jgi:molecular chaperone GrpE
MSKKKHHETHEEKKRTVTENEAPDTEKEELQKKLDEVLRAYAKCENDKKLLQKEADSRIEYAYEKFAKDLLPVIDSLELAIAHSGDIEDKAEAFDKLLEGVELTLKKLVDTFKNHGIEAVEHEEFNPEVHQAIQQVQSDEHEDGQIVDVFQKGYTLKGRVIRPSMVTINKK